jgi:hypothetical protein
MLLLVVTSITYPPTTLKRETIDKLARRYLGFLSFVGALIWLR